MNFDVEAFLQTIHFSPHGCLEWLPGTVFVFLVGQGCLGSWSHSCSYREGETFGSVLSQSWSANFLTSGRRLLSLFQGGIDEVFGMFAGLCK